MLENELKTALKRARPAPPEGFVERGDAQLRRLTEKEEKHMKKFSTMALVFALLLALTMAAAIAEGLFPWARGLEDGLQVTEEIKEAYKETELFDEPRLSVTQNGVTVTLDQCIVDTNAAYIAFRVQGYTPEIGWQPDFDRISVRVEDMEKYAGGWSASFFDGLVTNPEGQAVYPDGRVPEDYARLPYANEQGELLYLIKMDVISEDFSFVGKKAHVELKNLGVYAGKAQDITVAVEGDWTFDWVLKGTDKHLDLTNLNLPIGRSGAVLTGVHLSPIHVKLFMNVPREPVPEEGDFYAPYFRGVTLRDGTVFDLISDGGGEFYLDKDGDALCATYAISRVIEPEQVTGLLFTDMLHEEPTEVKLP